MGGLSLQRLPFPLFVCCLIVIHGCTGPPRFRSLADAEQPPVSSPSDPGISWPVKTGSDFRITSKFGDDRSGGRIHKGVDIAVCRGEEILASADGLVVFSDKRGSAGKTIEIDHGGGWSTLYAHNQMNLKDAGQHVARGDVIALMGDTGQVTGVHLHFEVRRLDVPVDPLLYLPGRKP